MFRCSVPDCGYVAEAITNHHCQQVHGRTKKEIVKMYGLPEYVRYDSAALKRNLELHIPRNPNPFWSGQGLKE